MKCLHTLLSMLLLHAVFTRHAHHAHSLIKQQLFAKHSARMKFKSTFRGRARKQDDTKAPVDSTNKNNNDNTKQTEAQKKYEQMQKDLKDQQTAKDIQKQNEENTKPLLPSQVKEYNSTFVNGSRPLPSKAQKIPSDWKDAELVKQISTYSKKFLRDFHDPKYKNKAFLVGKGVYLENNCTFDQQPSIVEAPQPKNVGVDVVQRKFNTQEKVNLWRKFFQEEFKQNYKDVSFNTNLTQALEDMSGIESIIKDKAVRISLENKYKAIQQLQQQIARNGDASIGAPDKILENTINPIKPIVFTKDKIKDITFTDQNIKNHLINIAPKVQGQKQVRFSKTTSKPSAFDQFLQQATLLSQMNALKKKPNASLPTLSSAPLPTLSSASLPNLLLTSKLYAQMLKHNAQRRFKVENTLR